MDMNRRISQTISPQLATDLYLGAILTVFLLWPGWEGYARITYHKATAYCCLTGLYAAVVVFLCRREICGGAWFRGWTLPQKLVGGYWLMTALSTLCAIDRESAFFGRSRAEGLLTISLYCLSFLLVSCYGRVGKWMLGLFGAAVSANCLVALIQLAGYNPFGLYPQGLNYYDGLVRYGGQFLGTIGNIDLLSALLCVAVPIYWIALLRLEGTERLILVVPWGLCLAVLGGMWVEGGVVGILGSLLLGLPVVLKGPEQRKAALVGTAAILVLGVLAVYLWGGDMSGAVFEAHELLHGRVDEEFGSGRLYIWREVCALVPERPFLGGGPETLGLRTGAAFERYDAELGILIRSTVDVAHNEYLNILVNQGILALLCYLGALGSAALRWIEKAPCVPSVAICGGGVLGYCIQAFFGISSPITAPFFWLSFALFEAS